MERKQELATQRWNQEYLAGKYKDEGSIPFVGEILMRLETDNRLDSKGLYVGCGNGRNYIPLIDAGLSLDGLDISQAALRQIETKRPSNPNKLVCTDFLSYTSPHLPDYIISIQVFQHGRQAEIAKYFEKTARLLKAGGLFFLRVNSTSTQIFHKHTVTEISPEDGKTIEYIDGPKTGMNIHFYTRTELEHLTADFFEPVSELTEAVIERNPPHSGRWVQWEGIWYKKN